MSFIESSECQDDDDGTESDSTQNEKDGIYEKNHVKCYKPLIIYYCGYLRRSECAF